MRPHVFISKPIIKYFRAVGTDFAGNDIHSSFACASHIKSAHREKKGFCPNEQEKMIMVFKSGKALRNHQMSFDKVV